MINGKEIPENRDRKQIADLESTLVDNLAADTHNQLTDEVLEAETYALFRQDRDQYHADENISDERLRSFTVMQNNMWFNWNQHVRSKIEGRGAIDNNIGQDYRERGSKKEPGPSLWDVSEFFLSKTYREFFVDFDGALEQAGINPNVLITREDLKDSEMNKKIIRAYRLLLRKGYHWDEIAR